MTNPLDIDDQSKQLAKDELGENPATKLQQIEAVKKWIISHNYLECRTDDEFILRFLRVSKFSCEAAKERIEKFIIGRTSTLDGMPEWFGKQSVDNEELLAILETGIIYPLARPDDQGRIIILTNYGAGAKFEPYKNGQAAFMMVDYIIAKYPRAQINGVRLVENAAGYNKDQMMYWNLERVPKAIGLWQGAYPMRIKSIDWFNVPAFARVVMEAGMLVMKAKIRDRMTIHSKYETPAGVPNDLLPPFMGGTGPKWEDIKDDVLGDLRRYQSEMDLLNMCKVLENKRPKKVYQGDSLGISGTYITTTTD